MNKFEIGKEYFTHSVCDSECRFTIKVTGRIEKTVSYIYDGNARRSKIRVDDSGEYIQPDRYSMAPVFRAKREVLPEEVSTVEESAAPAPAEKAASSNVITVSQPADDGAVIVMIGQRVECVCGACYPVQDGTVIGFESSPATRFFPSCVYAVVRWDDRPTVPERVRLSDIHRRGWRSANGSPLGVFVAG